MPSPPGVFPASSESPAESFIINQRPSSEARALAEAPKKTGKGGARRAKRKYRESLILLLIAPLSIPESQTKTKDHNSNRRKQQHEHRPVQRLLAFLRRAPGVSIAHRAALPKAGHGANAEHRQQCKSSSFATKKRHRDSQFYFTPSRRIRSASGKKKKYMITKQPLTAITSNQRMIAFSNFRCMK
jgi:hypothetical protein